jgi:hypothetical protein
LEAAAGEEQSLDSQGQMKDTLATKIAAICFLLSMAAEFTAIGIIFDHGGPPAIEMTFDSGQRLAQLAHSSWPAITISFGILAPALTMVALPGMYQVLASGGSVALPGVIVSSFGMLIGVIAETIRLGLVTTLPAAYIQSVEEARPTILAFGTVLGKVFQIMDLTAFVVLCAAGLPLIAIAIVRGRDIPSWIGWTLVIPTVFSGYIGAPALLLGYPIGALFLALGNLVLFAWLIVIGVLLLRWRPSMVGAAHAARTV